MPIRKRKSRPIVRRRSRKSVGKGKSVGRGKGAGKGKSASKSASRQPAVPAIRKARKSRKSTRARRRAADEGVGSARRHMSRKTRASKRRLSKYAKASDDMTIIELQKMAREQGIPFGGLSKSKLLRKINKYLESYY